MFSLSSVKLQSNWNHFCYNCRFFLFLSL